MFPVFFCQAMGFPIAPRAEHRLRVFKQLAGVSVPTGGCGDKSRAVCER